jgi:pantoate--beta-alanine ligase
MTTQKGGIPVKIINTIAEMRTQVYAWRREGCTLGLVPTMGDLHEGKASLIKASVGRCDRTVVSVYGSELPYGDTERQQDAVVCEKLGADVLFCPEGDSLRPGGENGAFVELPGDMVNRLGGGERPGYFREVCTVTARLFNILTPDRAFFGEKDAQQLVILRRMVRELCYAVEIVSCPVVRAANGLAVAGRNRSLSPEERKAALCLLDATRLGRKMVLEGERDARVIVNAMRNVVAHEPLACIDYVEAVDPDSLEPVDEVTPGVLFCLAVYLGSVRLTDNFKVMLGEQ